MNIEFFRWTWPALGEIAVFLLIWLVLIYTKRAPSVSSIREFVDIFSDRGGVIVMLGALSIYFFISAMRLFYVAITLMGDNKLDPQNSIILMGIQFVTGTAFGGSFGAMLKTMNGQAPPPEPPPVVTATTTSTKEIKTVTPAPKPPDAGTPA